MVATIPKSSSRRSQIPLAGSDGKSIIPPEGAKCPNCQKIGGIMTCGTNIRTEEGRCRSRCCKLCGYFFETQMKLPLHCVNCNSFDNYAVVKTSNSLGGRLSRIGIHRIYKCLTCGKNTPAFEYFPVPDDKVKRPDLRHYD